MSVEQSLKEYATAILTAREAEAAAARNGVARSRNLNDQIDVSTAPTDTLVTNLFMDRFGDRVCYVRERKAWYVWDGRRWIVDLGGDRMTALMQEFVGCLYTRAGCERQETRQKSLASFAKYSASARAHRAMAQLATGRLKNVRNITDFDADPFLFNVANGVIDLRTGELREHRCDDFMTRISDVKYNPDAACPRFVQFVDEVFCGDTELTAYIQRFAGYSLTGDSREQVFILFYGVGSNGKSTLIGALRSVLGAYAVATPSDTFLPRKPGAATNDLAALSGARFVSAVETEAGRKLAEALIKAVTGGDPIPARFLHAEFFTYVPQFKPVLAVNHLPIIRGGDRGIWRRVHAVPFRATFEGKRSDQTLAEKLHAERSGILAWCVRGCLDWQREGLGEPEAVNLATKDYRVQSDVFDSFLRERCKRDDEASISAKALRDEHMAWAEPIGEDPLSANMIGRLLAERGFRAKHTSLGSFWVGLRKRSTAESTDNGRTAGEVMNNASF